MSEPFAFRHLNRLVGLFVIGSAVVLLAAVVLMGRARHWFAKEFTLTVALDRNNLGLLRPGLPVKIQGTEAGTVVSARQDDDHTVARIALREEFRAQLRGDAKAIIHTPIAGFLGETFIEIWPGQADAPLDVETGVVTQLPGDDLLQQARWSITSVGQAAGQMRDLIAENRVALAATVDAVRATSVSVSKLVEDNRVATGAALTRAEALAREAQEAIAENRANVKAATDALPGAVAAVRTTADAATDTAKRAGTAAEALTATAGQLGTAATEARETIAENRDDLALAMGDLRALAAESAQVAHDLQAVTAQVAAGKGSLGKLVMDDTVHDQAVRAIDNANHTMEAVQPLVTTLSEVKLFIGVQGGGNLNNGVESGSGWLRLEPNPDKFYQGGLTYRGPPRSLDRDEQTSSGFPVDVDLLLGWRFLGKDDGTHWLSFGVGLLESRLGGILASDLIGDRLGIEVQGRGAHRNRDENDRRFEDAAFLVRATARVRLAWRVYALVGGERLGGQTGWWLGGRIELLDNDLRNLTTFGPLFR